MGIAASESQQCQLGVFRASKRRRKVRRYEADSIDFQSLNTCDKKKKKTHADRSLFPQFPAITVSYGRGFLKQ